MARLVLTRPQTDAEPWRQALQARGHTVASLPLIAIAAAPDPRPLQRAWQQLGDWAALMFVSGNAVRHFFEQKPAVAPVQWAWGAIKTRAWAPGPGTREALLAAGLDARLVDSPAAQAAQFDSEALWQQVGGQLGAGTRVLVVRGGDASGQAAGRDWLMAQLLRSGVQVDTVVAYLRHAPVLDAQQLALARSAAHDGSVWLFSSSEALAHLERALPGQDWSRARALVTHPRIAQAARSAGFGVVCESRPAVDAVAAALESIE
ncbi:uroporphyrinogen-III synthase [uncultured Ramlibacter sp.]|uniref:uroporphyrinogen-III synthase n=1 Tax=uncultured Ramlibacter sp. TaxID=260755 RepID=UPI00260738C8|nr:uroporphyrinogen-III synthase [uncultured Ramlibacter sp.]